MTKRCWFFAAVALALAVRAVSAPTPDGREQDVIPILREHLREPQPSEEQATFLRKTILAHAADPAVQDLVAATLAGKDTSNPMRLVLLEMMRSPGLKKLPEAWLADLEPEVKTGELETRWTAATVIQERGISKFDALLNQLAMDTKQPAPLRVELIAALGPRLRPVDVHLFEFLRQESKGGGKALERLAAARALASLHLTDSQVLALVPLFQDVDALVLPVLVRPVARSANEGNRVSMIINLPKAPAASSISPDELARMMSSYSSGSKYATRAFLQSAGDELDKQQARLDELTPLLTNGDLTCGKDLFFGKTAGCANCHRVNAVGGTLGPDLTGIGGARTNRDLLGSIVFPSPSALPAYQLYQVDTKDGQSRSGVIARLSPDTIWLRGTNMAEVRIDAGNIANLHESPGSLMPAGYADKLTKDELRDLLAYLQSLK